MLLGGLMERNLANSPNIVWGAGKEIEMKTTESHMVLANGQNQKFKSKGQRENSKATEQCVSPSLSLILALLWKFQSDGGWRTEQCLRKQICRYSPGSSA